MTEHYSGHDPETGCAVMLIAIVLAFVIGFLGAWLIAAHVSASRPAQIMPTVPILAVDESDPGRTGTPRRPIRAPDSTPAPTRGVPTLEEAKAWARSVLSRAEWRCLDGIAIRESHWNPLARNPSSGAFGIPQAISGLTSTNPLVQVRWMVRYVERRYGSACRARAHIGRVGWY